MTLQAVPSATDQSPAIAHARLPQVGATVDQLRWASRLAQLETAVQLADEFGEYRLARQLRAFEIRLNRTA